MTSQTPAAHFTESFIAWNGHLKIRRHLRVSQTMSNNERKVQENASSRNFEHVRQDKPRILVVDDEIDYYQLVWVPTLKSDFDLEVVTTGEEALQKLQGAGSRPFDLVMIDLNLDETMPAPLSDYVSVLAPQLRRKGLSTSYLGQSLGLWLWHQTPGQRQRYCYVSAHPQMYVPDVLVTGEETEFNGASAAEVKYLICDRKPDPREYVQRVQAIWAAHGW